MMGHTGTLAFPAALGMFCIEGFYCWASRATKRGFGRILRK